MNKNQIINTPMYEVNGVTYNERTHKPITGIKIKNKNENIIYSTYKNGILIKEKEIENKSYKLLKKVNYDLDGLMHGESANYKLNIISNYTHGVREGETVIDNFKQQYLDGVYHGLVEKIGRSYSYDSGIIVNETPIQTKKLKKRIIKNNKKRNIKNYTGEIYSKLEPKFLPYYKSPYREKYALEIRGYEQGELRYIKYYKKNGQKAIEVFLYDGDIKKKSKEIIYKNGKLMTKIEYDISGNKDGIEISLMGSKYNEYSYQKGVLHGRSKRYYPYTEHKPENGSYNLGVFSGEKNGKNYIDGIKTNKKIINRITINKNHEEKSEYKYLSNEIYIKIYNNRILEKKYRFIKGNLKEIVIYQKNGRKEIEKYVDGIKRKIISYNSDNQKDGKLVIFCNDGSEIIKNYKKDILIEE